MLVELSERQRCFIIQVVRHGVIVAQGGPIQGTKLPGWSLAQLWSRQHAAGSARAKILVV